MNSTKFSGAEAVDRLSTRLHHPARITRVTSSAIRLARSTFTATPVPGFRAFPPRMGPAPTFLSMAGGPKLRPSTRVLREILATLYRPGPDGQLIQNAFNSTGQEEPY